jgi:enamine deaminase RidA (YjgF/YER057c/UK114 family)
MNIPWEKRFPDMDDRPPHKYVGASLAAAEGAALQVLAIRGGARKCLVIPGMQHGDPMSMGARTGNMITSSRIFGMKTQAKEMSKTIEECAATIFENAATLLAQGGGDWNKLAQATAFIGNPEFAAPVEANWRKHLGDQPSARLNIIVTDLGGGGGVPRLEIVGLA